MLGRTAILSLLVGSGCGLSVYVYRRREELLRLNSSKSMPCMQSPQKINEKVEISAEKKRGTDLAGCSKDESKSVHARMKSLVERAQTVFCREIQRLEEGKLLSVEKFDRKPSTGNGVVCILQDGKVFERVLAIVNASGGSLTEGMEKQMKKKTRIFQRSEDGQLPFVTVGISSVVHPVNPHCPSLHFNFRFFEVVDATKEKTCWFGGGIDLTPSYLDEEDIRHFHRTIKKTCDRHNESYYPTFKRWCDEYHYIPIHHEHRGVGGIFFDDLDSDDPQKIFDFVQSCVESIVPAYIPIIEKNMNKPYTPEEKQWQQIRRGRYVEFNLLYDRGVKFGLSSPHARIENVLASLPLTARWEYRDGCFPETGSPEHQMMCVLRNPRDWVGEENFQMNNACSPERL